MDENCNAAIWILDFSSRKAVALQSSFKIFHLYFNPGLFTLKFFRILNFPWRIFYKDITEKLKQEIVNFFCCMKSFEVIWLLRYIKLLGILEVREIFEVSWSQSKSPEDLIYLKLNSVISLKYSELISNSWNLKLVKSLEIFRNHWSDFELLKNRM